MAPCTSVISGLCQALEPTVFLVHPVLAAIAEDAVAAHFCSKDSAWKLARTLQEVQVCTADHDLCLSCSYSQSFLSVSLSVIIKNRKISTGHMVKMKLKDWSTLAPFLSVMYSSPLFKPPKWDRGLFLSCESNYNCVFISALYRKQRKNTTVSIGHCGKVRGIQK